MLVIRLQRTGRRNSPAYRVVVAEKTSPVRGKSIELLGHYLPTRDPAVFDCNEERVKYWVSKGAKPSNTLARLLIVSGMKDMEKFTDTYTKKKPKKEPEEAPAKEPAKEDTASEDVKEEVEESAESKVQSEEIKQEAEEKSETPSLERPSAGADEDVKEDESTAEETKEEGDNEEKTE